MQVKILGSAAGGGFPQWNCACPNCHALRGGQFQGKARSQTQVAISSDGETWFLLGASPDLRYQIESSPELYPRSGTRSSPIGGVILVSVPDSFEVIEDNQCTRGTAQSSMENVESIRLR